MPIDSAAIKKRAKEIGFHLVGVAALDSSAIELAAQRLEAWLAAGYHGEMGWMENPRRRDPRALLPGVRSIIALALNYYQPDQRQPGAAKISRYAWGRDYHKVCTQKLKALARWIEEREPQAQVKFYTDTGPISDKVWAEAAGLGWIGKNGNLITRQYGSWVFLGEILTDLELETDRPHAQHCGTCTRCITACPTAAIISPAVVDARQCIAYHTIENRSPELPSEIAPKLEGWVAGCDICQEVCPWNERFARPTDVLQFTTDLWRTSVSLEELANLTEEEWQLRFTGSALKRIKLPMFRRNARANLNRRHE